MRFTGLQIFGHDLGLNNHRILGPGFTSEFYQTLREELTPVFLKLSQKICTGRSISKLICGAIITLMLNANKDITHKLQASITDEHRVKILNKILANQLQQYSRRIIHHDLFTEGLMLEVKLWSFGHLM